MNSSSLLFPEEKKKKRCRDMGQGPCMFNHKYICQIRPRIQIITRLREHPPYATRCFPYMITPNYIGDGGRKEKKKNWKG